MKVSYQWPRSGKITGEAPGLLAKRGQDTMPRLVGRQLLCSSEIRSCQQYNGSLVKLIPARESNCMRDPSMFQLTHRANLRDRLNAREKWV